MGTFIPPPRIAPDGTPHRPGREYDEYIQNIYQPNQDFAASFGTAIPGLTGPVGNGMGPAFGAQPGAAPTAPVPGLMPPQTGGYAPPPFASAFQASGPYGLMAQQMAGMGGGNRGIPRPPPQNQVQMLPPGLLQQPGAQFPLQPPPKGFRIPGGK